MTLEQRIAAIIAYEAISVEERAVAILRTPEIWDAMLVYSLMRKQGKVVGGARI